MLVELGPVAAADVQSWTRFARRIVTELRTDPEDLAGIACEDFLTQWSSLIDEWSAAATPKDTFRWSQSIDVEQAEFLLHGLDRCYQSPGLRSRITDDEAEEYRRFTVHLIGAFIDGLAAEGRPHEHYAEELRESPGELG